jgi:hypothetical protein
VRRLLQQLKLQHGVSTTNLPFKGLIGTVSSPMCVDQFLVLFSVKFQAECRAEGHFRSILHDHIEKW